MSIICKGTLHGNWLSVLNNKNLKTIYSTKHLVQLNNFLSRLVFTFDFVLNLDAFAPSSCVEML